MLPPPATRTATAPSAGVEPVGFEPVTARTTTVAVWPRGSSSLAGRRRKSTAAAPSRVWSTARRTSIVRVERFWIVNVRRVLQPAPVERPSASVAGVAAASPAAAAPTSIVPAP